MRKKRRKAVYVPYDYEAAYKNSLDKMEEANEERILKEGKVKASMQRRRSDQAISWKWKSIQSLQRDRKIRSRMKGKEKGKDRHRRI